MLTKPSFQPLPSYVTKPSTFLIRVKVFKALWPGDDIDVLHEDVPRLGAQPRHGDLEADAAYEARPDVEGRVEEPEGVPPEGNILQLDLSLLRGLRSQVLGIWALISLQTDPK